MVFSPQEHKLLAALIARLSGLGAVSRIIVFGSRARGRSGEDSDLGERIRALSAGVEGALRSPGEPMHASDVQGD
ncbi:MAG: nucleotidyltransferase domain-containing protein [Syntrophobacteraceae bacterium]|jgi:hypothetical protein|nr:nucleotidyltransferase domain-containing protein [Syntrophobacteraceae bacterium]